jgi:hypothetical protein
MTRIEVPSPSLRSSATRRFMRRSALLVLLILGGVGLWTWLTLAWAYSDGERAGVLQKFSRKGWVCKTHEGQIAFYYGGGQYLAPGTSPQMWDFSVRDKTVAAQLDKAVGHRVQLHYTEHRGIPTSCFAETQYFVDRVTDEEVGNQSSPAPGAPPPALPDVRPRATVTPPSPPTS